jgi:hypothetical protein
MEPVILAKTDEDRAARQVELDVLLERLAEVNPKAMFLAPRAEYDLAITDITDAPEDQWGRKEQVFVAVYNTQATIEAIKLLLGSPDEDDEDYDEDTAAWEWFGYNTSGAWMGEGTPTFTCYGCDVGDCDEHDGT